MRQTIAILMFAGLAAGCASTMDSQAPTHRWESTAAASEIQYRNDHARCQAKADAKPNADTFSVESAAFAAYKQCMESSGYELTAYSGQ